MNCQFIIGVGIACVQAKAFFDRSPNNRWYVYGLPLSASNNVQYKEIPPIQNAELAEKGMTKHPAKTRFFLWRSLSPLSFVVAIELEK